MRAPAVLVLTAVALAAVSTAVAQAPTGPAGNYGGGAVVKPPDSLGGPGNMLISFRVTEGTGRVELNVGIGTGARCASPNLSLRTTLAPDGSFSVSGARSVRLDPGRVSQRYEIAGTVAGPVASGTARLRNTDTQKGRRARTCTSGTVRWGARRPGTVTIVPGVVPKARLYGTTSQVLHRPHRAIVMRISSDAKRLTRALYDINLNCNGRRLTDTHDSPRRNLTIQAGGRVSNTERFTFRDRTTITRAIEHFDATIGMTGAAGTLRIDFERVDRRTRAKILVCHSGDVNWIAST